MRAIYEDQKGYLYKVSEVGNGYRVFIHHPYNMGWKELGCLPMYGNRQMAEGTLHEYARRNRMHYLLELPD